MMSPCNKTNFITLVAGKVENIWFPISIVSLPCSEREKFHAVIDVVVASIDR